MPHRPLALLAASLAVAAAAGGALPAGSGAAVPCTAPDANGVVTCTYTTPGSYSLTVPAAATGYTVSAYGAQGGSTSTGAGAGGDGGVVSSVYGDPASDVSLGIVVAGQGGSSGGGGYPNGGAGGASDAGHAGGGGGSSSVVDDTDSANPVLLVEAGGGGGSSLESFGGDAESDGGPRSPRAGDGRPGTGATEFPSQVGSGGAGGAPTTADCVNDFGTGSTAAGNGGNGQNGTSSGQGGAGGNSAGTGGDDSNGGGGGGGGGVLGGGGGGGAGSCNMPGFPFPVRTAAGSGGGGSSFIGGASLSGTFGASTQTGDGKVVVTYTVPVAPARQLSVTLDSPSFIEGIGFSGEVATFTDSNTSDAASDFTASIDWGDGVTSDGSVSGSNGSFSVSGTHTYADEAGNGPISVTVSGPDSSSDSATASAAPDVADQAPGVSVPALLVTATGLETPVRYASLVNVSEYDDTPVSLSCSPASGARFALGTTTVSCTATNADGTSSPPSSFPVTVQLRFLGFSAPKSGARVKGGSPLAVAFRLGTTKGALSDADAATLTPVVSLTRTSGAVDTSASCPYSKSAHRYSCSITTPTLSGTRTELVWVSLSTANGDVPLHAETPVKITLTH